MLAELDEEMLATVAEAQAERAERESWRTTDELVAMLIEVVDRGDRWFFEANSKKGTAAPDPIVVNRPAVRRSASETEEPDAPRHATAAEMKAFFGGAVEYTP